MTVGVVLLNFGEPAEATLEAVVPFLERIFLAHSSLEGVASPEAARARARELARRRAPGLVASYQAIGGSPLSAQAQAQAEALAGELARRGHAVRVYVANQYVEPLLVATLRRARDEGVEELVALPLFPVCGPTTNVAALERLRAELAALDWDVPVVEIGGWHRHPGYVALRADGIRETAAAAALDLASPRQRLVFSAHGTPTKYVQEGSQYVRYTEEHCADIAQAAGVADFALGYQNHGNRSLEWTQPSIERVTDEIDADAVVVVPVSFMHEQSETLVELDIELRRRAEARGLRFVRVPVPHADPRFAPILADLVESALASGAGPIPLRPCRCRPAPNAFCTNT